MLTVHAAQSRRTRGARGAIGLAVAGGGPLGAVYELGALRALEESIEGLELHELDAYVGVSAGAFIAASLANRITLRELCRIFMGREHASLRFVPERFLRPAYREYVDRAVRVPAIVRDTLSQLLRHPAEISISEIMAALGRALPSGLFDNESIHDFLAEAFTSAGRGNRFEDLDCTLSVVAVDLDSGQAVRFGHGGDASVPISRAVQASAALPGLYPPVEIMGRHYVDGALRRTLHASVALDQGVDLLFGINPLVPYDAGDRPQLKSSRLIEGGLPLILSQTFRALIQSRMKVGFGRYRDSHAHADLVLMEPDRGDERIFFTNIFSYASRVALCEHAYQATRADLRARADELAPVLARHDMALDHGMLDDGSRTLEASITYRLESHSRVSRDLSRVLDELESRLGPDS